MALKATNIQDQGTDRIMVDFSWQVTAATEHLDVETLVDVSALDPNLADGKGTGQLKIQRIWCTKHLKSASSDVDNAVAVYLTDSVNNVIAVVDRDSPCYMDYRFDGEFLQSKAYAVGNETPNGDVKIGIGTSFTKSSGAAAGNAILGSFVRLLIEFKKLAS